MTMANRPDCAYFLLLGLCGAAFLLTIGGILTYVAFNPGSIDGRPHSALSHIPHFHHHGGHHPQHPDQHHLGYHHPTNNHLNTLHNNTTSHHEVTQQTPDFKDSTPTEIPKNFNSTGNSTHNNHTSQTQTPHHSHNAPQNNHHHEHETSSETTFRSYEAKAKQSLVLAIIGPLCLLMGILVTLIVGVLALRYDCDHEPEPNIAFLRLRSEMSLNYDPDKNNYELLRPVPSSSIDQAGGTFSINPTGIGS